MVVRKYQGSITIEGQQNQVNMEMEWKFTETLGSDDGLTPGPQRLEIASLKVNGTDLYTLTTNQEDNAATKLKTIAGEGESFAKKIAAWGPRGNDELVTRCFVSDNMFFNTGTSVSPPINIDGINQVPCESYFSIRDGRKAPAASEIYAASIFMRMTYKQSSATWPSSKILYTTNNDATGAMLTSAGWNKLGIDDELMQKLAGAGPELGADGKPMQDRECRFKIDQDHTLERCRVQDNSEQGWHYGYENKDVFVLDLETPLAGIVYVPEEVQ